jgi:hypothetical protein
MPTPTHDKLFLEIINYAHMDIVKSLGKVLGKTRISVLKLDKKGNYEIRLTICIATFNGTTH